MTVAGNDAEFWWMQESLQDRALQSTLSWIMLIALQIRPLFLPCSGYQSWQVIYPKVGKVDPKVGNVGECLPHYLLQTAAALL